MPTRPDLVVFLAAMSREAVDLWRLFVDVPDEPVNKVVEPVRHAVIQRRVEEHVGALQLHRRLEQRHGVGAWLRAVQQELQAAVDRREEPVHHHLVHVVHVRLPDVRVRTGAEQL